MLDEIAKLQLKKGVWQNIIENEMPIDNARVELDYPDTHTVYFRISQNDQPVAKFALSFLYGCKGVLVSHTVFVEEPYRGLGIAKTMRAIEHMIAKDLKATVLLCTVRDDNKPYENVIKDWTKVGSFDNERTGNRVNIFTIPVKK
jgi:hypothetical protein